MPVGVGPRWKEVGELAGGLLAVLLIVAGVGAVLWSLTGIAYCGIIAAILGLVGLAYLTP